MMSPAGHENFLFATVPFLVVFVGSISFPPKLKVVTAPLPQENAEGPEAEPDEKLNAPPVDPPAAGEHPPMVTVESMFPLKLVQVPFTALGPLEAADATPGSNKAPTMAGTANADTNRITCVVLLRFMRSPLI